MGVRLFNIDSGILPKSQLQELLMQTSRFQLGLIATLAVGLGFSLSLSDAVGYPAGAAVSMASNPVWSVSVRTGSRTYEEVLAAPEGMDIIVTDVAFGMDGADNGHVLLGRSGAGDIAQYVVCGRNAGCESYRQSMTSGLRVPAGESLQIKVSYDASAYTLSGYYAQP